MSAGRWRVATASRLLALVFAAILASLEATGQQTPHAPSGTQPSPGVTLARERVQFLKFDTGITRFEARTILAHGFTPEVAGFIELPVVVQSGDDIEASAGLADFDVTLQYRFLQNDPAPLDTLRGAVQIGVELPGGEPGLTSGSADPFVGVALTQVNGRHGTGAYGRYQLNTGSQRHPVVLGTDRHDVVRAGASYLYRIDPAAFSAERRVGTYLVAEVNGILETDGDHAVWFSPGIMVEAPQWTLELATRLPLSQDSGEAMDLDWGLTVGVRFYF